MTGAKAKRLVQLPVTAKQDPTCVVPTGPDKNSFGPHCTGSALGGLYSFGLGRAYPESAVGSFHDAVGPFQNLQPSLYWTADPAGPGNQSTFSFNGGAQGQNTTAYNYFYVLPRVPGFIGKAKPSGTGLVVYGSGAWKAVYDPAANPPTGVTWLLDANLAGSNHLGVKGDAILPLPKGGAMKVPKINGRGAMLLPTADAWLAGLNAAFPTGQAPWALPSLTELQTLYGHLGLAPGDKRFLSRSPVGPLQQVQPFFYWSCERDTPGDSRSACNGQDPGKTIGKTTKPMAFAFNFDTGFQGTDEEDKTFYVAVYRVAAPPRAWVPPSGRKCQTPPECCAGAGGNWTGVRCE